MAKNLVIVESPAKAKTIESYLGKDYLVMSSYGHVRDLSEKGLSVDIENNFTPIYIIPEDKKKIISELKKLSKQAETVWLASDEDREGEAISWHLTQALELDEKKTKRIVFNEITKSAILKAIENPRKIDYNLVNAQQARRVLDRLVGYELSPVLWKKVKPSLSAGRVQSVAVRLIVERERERNAFKVQSFYRVIALFSANGKMFRAELSKRFDSKNEAQEFLKQCQTATFTVQSVEQKPGTKSPSAPFTTSTLQQEASRKLGFSVARTMQLAQKLYESGKITYMRTDSVNMSDYALQAAESAIHQMYGKEYHQRRQFSTKSKGAQEAHECIRPTDMSIPTTGADASEIRLYELIWKRSIASQMSDAKLEKTIITVNSPQHNLYFSAKGEVIKFDGFLKVYLEGTDDEEEDQQEQQLPDVKKGDHLQAKEIIATERFTSPPPRYTEASLVKKLEELGIGRPSTYAPTISTIQNRGYVVKEDRPGEVRKYHVLSLRNNQLEEEVKEEITGAEKNKLFPTDIGALVNDFLVEHFGKIVDYNFTATVEKEFDEIASGNLKWEKMIKGFYKPFHEIVEETEKTSKRVTGKRELGIDPASGKKVYALIGRFGPMIQIGEVEEEEKPRYASLRKGQSIESITLEQALDLFKLPRTLGEFEGKEMVVGIGRFGPYIRHDGKFVSIPKGIDPMEIDELQARQLIIEKRNAEQNRIIQSFEGGAIQILRGRFGPYITNAEGNYKIPKDVDAEKLTLDEVKEIIATSKPSGKSAKKVSLKKEQVNETKVKKAASAKKKASPVKKKKAATKKKSTTKSK
ncbi:MAG: type I DNA topoisomerase [Flavobacteriales bacterium]|nr:type I DNA topoisomerase [Flavobacteriales bacterium]